MTLSFTDSKKDKVSEDVSISSGDSKKLNRSIASRRTLTEQSVDPNDSKHK